MKIVLRHRQLVVKVTLDGIYRLRIGVGLEKKITFLKLCLCANLYIGNQETGHVQTPGHVHTAGLHGDAKPETRNPKVQKGKR